MNGRQDYQRQIFPGYIFFFRILNFSPGGFSNSEKMLGTFHLSVTITSIRHLSTLTIKLSSLVKLEGWNRTGIWWKRLKECSGECLCQDVWVGWRGRQCTTVVKREFGSDHSTGADLPLHRPYPATSHTSCRLLCPVYDTRSRSDLPVKRRRPEIWSRVNRYRRRHTKSPQKKPKQPRPQFLFPSP